MRKEIGKGAAADIEDTPGPEFGRDQAVCSLGPQAGKRRFEQSFAARIMWLDYFVIKPGVPKWGSFDYISRIIVAVQTLMSLSLSVRQLSKPGQEARHEHDFLLHLSQGQQCQTH